MPKPDLILLHAPSVYDFRERPAMHGPISDVIPATSIFEMYPLGYVSIVGYLEKHGYHVRILNLAVKMLKNPRLNVENLLENLDAKAFGIDLHWLAHAAGSLDIAEKIKKLHPDLPIILGGLSATYFHHELIKDFPQVDYVLRGDTTEKPLLKLMECIEKDEAPNRVENLTWRSRDGNKHVNPLSFVPTDIDDLWMDYGEIVKLVVRHRDLESTLPYENFMEYPFTAVLTCKGCTYSCVTCGGSSYAFKNFFKRDEPVFKTPEKLIEEMNVISEYFKGPLFLIGDLRQAGKRWAGEVLSLIKKMDFDNTITYELFDAVPTDYMKKLASSANSWTLEISPESHDDSVRKTMGKPYTTAEMEKSIKTALEYGCRKIDIYFMVGLPKQTYNSVLESVEFCRHLYETMRKDDRIFTFIAPMAPFLDPGSIIFENPSGFGFTTLYKTLGEHKEALHLPSWKLYLSYHTDWMTRDEIAEVTYEALIRMNKLKAEMGVIGSEEANQINFGLNLSKDVMRKIDNIIASAESDEERVQRYRELRWEIEEAKRSTEFAKKELRMPGAAGIRVKGALKYLLKLARILK